MASRFTSIKPLTRCLNPVTVWHDDRKCVVPCGKCAACLLDKANDWSMRLANEIESTPYPIFFTLTYSNTFVPKLKYIGKDGFNNFVFDSNSEFNIRHNGVRVVPRVDDIQVYSSYFPKNISNNNDPCFGYASKRDIQLWLKSIRQDIIKQFPLKNETDRRFRYYVIAEYGPTTYRPHYHGLLFFRDFEIAEYALRISMYKNWQMCDKSLFDQYTHYCGSGAAGYVTQYVTGVSSLPQIFKDEQIRPFRLCSKNPSIGFVSFDKKEIYECLYSCSNEYNKTVKRIESEYIFCYPSKYMHRLFPKCREFNLQPPFRLYWIYEILYFYSQCRPSDFETISAKLRETMFPSDYSCALACFRFCQENPPSRPVEYLYLLDMYYYKEQMFALKKFYEWQQEHADKPISIIYSYSNFTELCTKYLTFDYLRRFTLDMFLGSFGVDAYEFCSNLKTQDLLIDDSETRIYEKQVEDILADSQKMPKFNEKFGFAPHSV